jgi:glycosyltransferase involved in cell wall biosynthesis
MSPVNSPVGATGKVSIVIPCYNHGLMLLETLASIEQVRSDIIAEVIIVNDGSNEPTTCQILQDLDANKYMVVHQSNQGLGRARNAGIEIARGEFILPLDSDNLIRGTYFDQGVALLIQNPDVGVVYGDAEYFGERTGRWRVAGFDVKRLVKGNYIDACALYRKNAWESVGGYDEKMPVMGWEDWDFWMRVALRGWKFLHIDEIAFDYRVRQGSMISETVRHGDEIVEYIFKKREYTALKALREQAIENYRLRAIERSWDYKIGSSIVAPLRAIKRMLFSPSN